MGFHGVVWLLLAGAMIAGLVLLVRARGGRVSERTGRRALEILEERYARGEIQREEYLQKRRDLEGAL